MCTESEGLVIFGAKSIALGACLAIRELYPGCNIIGFMVSSMVGNTGTLCGLPVREIACYSDRNIHILVAVPEDIQEDIVKMLNMQGFYDISCLSSEKESNLMRCYYGKIGKFPALKKNIAEVYVAKFHGDRPLRDKSPISDWIKPIQVGAALTDKRVAALTDHTGRNISLKNANYCELTALYWIWKNRLCVEGGAEYYGLFHYRRFLDISGSDFGDMKLKDVDVVLPYPMVHEPDIREHHRRYIKEQDWESMLLALKELHPESMECFEDILNQPYFYNYNMLIAKKNVLRDYCGWLFPVLERTEELSSPKGNDRADRYIGYLGENLLTLYFMSNTGLKIRHCGRIMLK